MGILDRALSPSDFKANFVTIYSNPGVGKTTLASRLGQKNVFLTDETGVGVLRNYPELEARSKGRVFKFEGLNDFKEIVDAVEKHELECDNLVLDTFTGIHVIKLLQLLKDPKVAEILKLDIKDRRAIPLLDQRDYGLSGNMWTPVIQGLNAWGGNVTLLCHLKVPNPDRPRVGDATGPALPKMVLELVNKYSNVVAYMKRDEKGNRKLVTQGDTRLIAKSQINMPKEVSDDEFVKVITEWRSR
jgi:hypothetical protein